MFEETLQYPTAGTLGELSRAVVDTIAALEAQGVVASEASLSAIVSGKALCEGHMVNVKVELLEVSGEQLDVSSTCPVSDAQFLDVYHVGATVNDFIFEQHKFVDDLQHVFADLPLCGHVGRAQPGSCRHNRSFGSTGRVGIGGIIASN